jgi:hypothetical protein
MLMSTIDAGFLFYISRYVFHEPKGCRMLTYLMWLTLRTVSTNFFHCHLLIVIVFSRNNSHLIWGCDSFALENYLA